jgi:hypothetical protein
MDAFTSGLKMRVETALGQASPSGEVNPLVVIGLTQAMLELKLTEDQMYNVVHSYARQLATQIHPDRNPKNVNEENQRRIFEAFETLKDRTQFARALQEFRSLKAGDRSEINILRGVLKATKERLQHYLNKEASLNRNQAILERELSAFHRNKHRDEMRIPGLQGEVTRLEERVERLDAAAVRWKHRHSRLNSYVSSLCIQDPAKVHVLDAKWAVIAFLVPKFSPLPPFVDKEGALMPALEKALQRAGVRKEMNLALARSQSEVEEKFLSTASTSFKAGSRFYFGVMRLSGGRPKVLFGLPKVFNNSRVLGSIYSGLEIRREQLSFVTDRDTVFEHASPFLSPGGLLVSQSLWKWQRDRANEDPRPVIRTETRQLILAAG